MLHVVPRGADDRRQLERHRSAERDHIPELIARGAIGIPLTWAGIPLLVREVGLPLTRDWVMTCRPVAEAQELTYTPPDKLP